MDGNLEERRHTVSVFNGPAPQIRTFGTEAEEFEAVGAWLRTLTADGVQPHEIGVFVRSSDQVPRATAAATAAGLSARVLDDRVEVRPGSVNVATMHLAKGLEFRVVSVMACDDEVLPLQSRIEGVGRRWGSAGSVRHGATAAVRGVHAGARSAFDQRGRTGV